MASYRSQQAALKQILIMSLCSSFLELSSCYSFTSVNLSLVKSTNGELDFLPKEAILLFYTFYIGRKDWIINCYDFQSNIKLPATKLIPFQMIQIHHKYDDIYILFSLQKNLSVEFQDQLIGQLFLRPHLLKLRMHQQFLFS